MAFRTEPIGYRGRAGQDGVGVSAYALTTASFVMPAVGSSVVVAVSAALWVFVGMSITLESAGGFRVSGVSGLNMTLVSDGVGNAAAGVTIPAGKLVTPAFTPPARLLPFPSSAQGAWMLNQTSTPGGGVVPNTGAMGSAWDLAINVSGSYEFGVPSPVGPVFRSTTTSVTNLSTNINVSGYSEIVAECLFDVHYTAASAPIWAGTANLIANVTGTFSVFAGSGSLTASSSANQSISRYGVMRHLAWGKVAGNVVIYLDGMLVASTASAAAITGNGTLSIMQGGTAAGLIARCAIHNTGTIPGYSSLQEYCRAVTRAARGWPST